MDRPSIIKIFENSAGAKVLDLKSLGCSGFFAIYGKESGVGVAFSYRVGIDGENFVTPSDPLGTGADGSIGTITGEGYIPFLVPVTMYIEIIAGAVVDEAHLVFSLG